MLALALSVALAAGVFVVLLGHAGVGVKPVDTYELDAIVPTAIRLVDAADVRQAGVKIGKVSEVAPHGRHARLRLTLERRYAPVYDNARLLIRDKSLGGENYVDLAPGAPPGRPLREGATLPVANSPESTQLDQVLGVLKPKRVRDMRRIVEALGTGLGGRGQELNQFNAASSAATIDGYDVVQALADERLALTQLISDFGHVAETLGQRGQELRSFVRGSRRLSTTFADHDDRVGATLAAAPGFLRTARQSMRRMSRLSAVATPVVRDTRVATERMVPMMSRLDEASAGGRQAVGELTELSRRSVPMLAALRRFAPTAREFMRPLEGNLRELNPLLEYMEPYGRDGAVALSLIGATAKSHDATSHMWRIVPLVQTGALGGTLSKEELKALEALLATGNLLKHTTSRGKNPYPAPGPHKKLTDFKGAYPRVLQDPPYSKRGG
jgi:phospholipid/cholesterol/gamma-HCH transport system substrate-binding protein